MKASTAGEAKAMVVIAAAKPRILLKEANVTFPEDLPTLQLRQFRQLKAEEERLWEESRKLFVIADSHRQEIENGLTESLREIETQEQNSNKVVPSEAEMEEKRSAAMTKTRRARSA